MNNQVSFLETLFSNHGEQSYLSVLHRKSVSGLLTNYLRPRTLFYNLGPVKTYFIKLL